jgi:hypothetical protein
MDEVEGSLSFITAGAWVMVDDLFLFQFGPNEQGDKLGVVRLGGHLKDHENPWRCAVRELQEEANLRIDYLFPPCTYQLSQDEGKITPIRWEHPLVKETPVLRSSRGGVIFLAKSDDQPKPMNETRGLLLLSRSDVFYLSANIVTLQEYLSSGGRAIFRKDLPPLDATMQLQIRGPKILAKVLELHPDLGLHQ